MIKNRGKEFQAENFPPIPPNLQLVVYPLMFPHITPSSPPSISSKTPSTIP